MTTGLILNVRDSHPLTMTLGLGAIGLLLVMQRLTPRIPGPLVAVIVGTLLTTLLNLDLAGVKTVGGLPHGLPPFAIPDFTFGQLFSLMPAGLTIAMIGYLESFAVAGLIADKKKMVGYFPCSRLFLSYEHPGDRIKEGI